MTNYHNETSLDEGDIRLERIMTGPSRTREEQMAHDHHAIPC